MSFTSLDKALTDRAVRYVMQLASDLKAAEAPSGVWPKTPEGRKAKRLFDIYGRDAADMKALQARMVKDHADDDLVASIAKRRKPKPEVPRTVEDFARERFEQEQAGRKAKAEDVLIFGGVNESGNGIFAADQPAQHVSMSFGGASAGGKTESMRQKQEGFEADHVLTAQELGRRDE